MTKQGPSNGWELETRRILQKQLPEYDIDPHMRLANVVKGRTQFVKAMSQYEIDFTVRDKKTGHVICAIELDGPTHDTEDGKRRDANKNRWLHEAKIPLVRLRQPEEAHNIRDLIPLARRQKQTFHDALSIPKTGTMLKKYITSLVAVIIIAWLLTSTLNTITQKKIDNTRKDALVQQQRNQQEIQQRITAENWRKQQEAEQAEARRRIEAQQPRYERMLIKGKPARECSNGNVINNETILCMKDHYEMVLVSGNQ